MYPPIFPVVAANSPCTALLKAGQGAVRFYQFGLAPQNVVKPYGVWQRVFGSPDNLMDRVPEMDGFTLQVDVYAESADSARTVAAALRDAIEPHAHITSWLGESIDPVTKNNRFTFQVDWFVPRP